MTTDVKRYFIVADQNLLCFISGGLVCLSDSELYRLNLCMSFQAFIATKDREQYWVAAVTAQNMDGYQWLNLRAQLGVVSDEQFQLAGRAMQTLRWHSDHKFCGRCGKPTIKHSRDLAKTCVDCALDFYPRLAPCIITLIVRDDYCLLAHHAKSREPIFSCLAGFIEMGESPEQTVVREVMEEVSVNVDNIRYVASQPWPFPGQLMLGYFADYVSGDIMPDQTEILIADWFHYQQLPRIPSLATISGRLINAFVQQRNVFHMAIQ